MYLTNFSTSYQECLIIMLFFVCFVGTTAIESALVDENQKSQVNPDHEEKSDVTTNDSNFTSNVKADNENDKGKALDLPAKGASNHDKNKATSGTDTSINIAEHRLTELKTAQDASRPIDRSQIAATRTSLDHTITVSMIFI